MKNYVALSATLVALLCVSCAAIRAEETKLEITGVHACCAGCIKAMETALNSVEGVKGTYDKTGKKATVVAKDAADAQKALDALAAAGLHGETGNKDLAIKEDSGATAGKVKSLSLTGAHICCGTCVKTIQAAIQKVPGATAGAVDAKAGAFEVSGDFDAAELIKALNAAGIHAKVKK